MAENQRTHSSLSSNQTYPITIEEESIASMLSKQTQHPKNTSLLQTNTFLAGARTKSIDWILKANTHHSFSTATAVLAVNYFDNLLLNTLLFQQENRPPPWTTHLAAVACLSLAAKMEETHLPTLSNFQVEKNVFEAKTIQRMEILVLSKLQWKMNPVTPLCFLSYIAKNLKFNHDFSGEFLRRCECLLLDSISDCRFMNYLPSILAASIATLVMTGIADAGDIKDHIFSIIQIQKGDVDDCCKMIIEAVSRNYLQPGSPTGVTDASFSPIGNTLSPGRTNKEAKS
ncbi:cyclin-D3-3-like [Impatiens glandulifera]|uniref:cyclin-D3-3-like n=1 Tax=Impatiens glandulifera TaxID=253017 RepID=UPI001FB196CB|nr:cyclin-D3-3-like [Impatiens glandulifera]